MKTVAFLEYTSFLTKYANHYPMPMLVKLDNSIRRFFMQCLALNWDVTRPEIGRFLTGANIELARLTATLSKASNQQSSHLKSYISGGSGSTSYQGYHNHQSYNHSEDKHSNGGSTGNKSSDPKEGRCCNWNFKFHTNNPKCFRDHVCYECGDPGHKANN